ncbi:MAG: hypothetical protein PHQ64_02850 [Bacilli bacterium]|nr:hypothetical protein [Bacilli bacterium]
MERIKQSFFTLLPSDVKFLTNVEVLERVFAGKYNGFRVDMSEQEQKFLKEFVNAVIYNEVSQKKYLKYKSTLVRLPNDLVNKCSDIIIDAMYLASEEKHDIIEKSNISKLVVRNIEKDEDGNEIVTLKEQQQYVTELDAIFSIYKKMLSLSRKVITEDKRLMLDGITDIDLNRYDFLKDVIREEGYDNLYVSCIAERMEEDCSMYLNNNVASRMVQFAIENIPRELIMKIDEINGSINRKNIILKDNLLNVGVSRERLREENGLIYYRRRLFK